MNDSMLLQVAFSQFWQVTVLCVIVGWLSKTLLVNKPTLAYQLWLVVLVKCITPPLWSSHCGIFSWCFQHASTAFAFASGKLLGESHSGSLLVVLFAIWLTGSVGYLVRTLLTWRRIQRRIRAGAIKPSAEVEATLAALQRRLKIRKPIELVITEESIGPAVIGIQKPILVVPSAVVDGKNVDELEPILAHELLHIRRGDTLVAQLETLVRAVWWFHPTVQQAADSASQMSELCCDGEVLGELDYKPRRYADSLLSVLETKCRLQPLVGMPGIRSEQVTRDRLKRIMVNPSGKSRWILRVGLLILAAILFLPGRPIEKDRREVPSAATELVGKEAASLR